MSLNFDRSRTQLIFEKYIGIISPSDFENKDNMTAFKQYQLTTDNVLELKEALAEDSNDYYYNGLISLLEGLISASLKRYSWATVKLYYSVFYFLRSSFASKNYCLMRAKSMFRLKLETNEKVFTTGNKKYNSTHGGTISHYCDIYSSEPLLTNNIDFNGDEINIYAWMENIREIVNYRSRSFYEPSYLDFWEEINKVIDNNKFYELIENIIKNPLEFCFQEEYAVIAIPLARFIYTTNDFLSYSTLPKYNKSKIEFLLSLLPDSLYFSTFIKKLEDHETSSEIDFSL